MAENGGIYSSQTVSLIAGALFSLLIVCHFVLMCWKRAWFMVFMVLGYILEITGYFTDLRGYGAQTVQVIVAPVLLAASVHIAFGELIRVLNIDEFVPFNGILQSCLFFFADATSLGLLISGFILGQDRDDKTLGSGLVIGGFAIQVVLSLCFLTLIIIVHKKLLKSPYYQGGKGCFGWRSFLVVLYLATVLLFIRNVYRLVEYAIGWGGYVFRHAVFEYVLDGLPMLCLAAITALVHPGIIIGRLRAASMLGEGLLYEI